jgi:hypothetical protein
MRDHLLDLLLMLIGAVVLFLILGLFASAMDRAYPDRPPHRALIRKGH